MKLAQYVGLARENTRLMMNRLIQRQPKRGFNRRVQYYSTSNISPKSRFERVISRFPPRLQAPLKPLLEAPVSHVTAFLILHELTAIIPLIGLVSVFHSVGWLPSGWIGTNSSTINASKPDLDAQTNITASADGSAQQSLPATLSLNSDAGISGHHAVDESLRTDGDSPMALRIQAASNKFARYFERKEWFGFGDGQDGGNTRLLLEIAVAYTITKFLLPARIAVSVWATPWFARWAITPVTKMFGKGKRA